MKPSFLKSSFLLGWTLWAAAMSLSAQANSNHGLWVGEAVLGNVNEVTVPLDAAGIPRAPDSSVATPTFDAANLRLIIHVDAAGHASLLKQVAILSRKAGEQVEQSNLALVTDERLYGSFPPQPATRISSVMIDFGDAKATAAVDQVVNLVATAAATAAGSSTATQSTVSSAATAAAQPVVAQADAAQAFTNFLQNYLDKSKVLLIADGGSTATTTTATAMAAAVAMRDGSFYHDTRGIEMLTAITAALAALPTAATTDERHKAALNMASAFAETDLACDRLLAGELLGDMISAAADQAAATAVGLVLKPVTAFNSSPDGKSVDTVSTAHGLSTGAEVAIQGAAVAAYNGLHTVTRVDANTFRIAVTPVKGGSITGYAASRNVAPLQVTSVGHGLTSGTRVTIGDCSITGYNGTFLVTVLDANTFTVDAPFTSDPPQRGVWYARSGAISSYQGTADGTSGVKITAPNHGLDNGQTIEIRSAGVTSYNGLKTITRIDANSFSINQAFAGNPAAKGTWDIPVAITGFQPPATLDTLVTATGHGLATGDRVVITGSGKTDYNHEFAVTVVDVAHFSIPVAFDTTTGNPAVKGTWLPATGGQWRTTAPVRTAVGNLAKVNDTIAQAQRDAIAAYDDKRALDAVTMVLNAIIQAACVAESPTAAVVSATAAQAGRDALSTSVVRYPRPSTVPSTDYTTFVNSTVFSASVATAADAAATAALKENTNIIATPTSIRDKAMAAAIEALSSVYSTASRSLLTELPMTGDFGSGLTATIVLPANHPTNPFRHRRHPDHTTGFDITRNIKLTFDAADSRASGRAGYGVDRISGVYEEEIFGLHKPLGPNKDIGLKVRGTFQLNRISKIDTLNGR